MPLPADDLRDFLSNVHPYDALEAAQLDQVLDAIRELEFAAGQRIYMLGAPLEGLYVVRRGSVEVRDANDQPLSVLGPRNSFGERGLSRDGLAATTASAIDASTLLLLPKPAFLRLIEEAPAAARFFNRNRPARPRGNDLATSRVADLMTRDPLRTGPDTTLRDSARAMKDAGVSSLCVTEGATLLGLVTTRDMTNRVVAEGRALDTPIAQVMTRDLLTLAPNALGSDVLHAMMERRIGHVPICDGDRLVGIVTQTDLTRFQAVSSGDIIAEIAQSPDAAAMARVTARIPRLLVQLVAQGHRHDVVTRLITDIADAVTRRLLALAEAQLGPAPHPWLWLACGSQGRQEQTGVSDQDNCLFLDDAVTEDDLPYYDALARFVSDGLNLCGYVYCPGDMMATNPQWRQPLRVWRDYFRGWIAKPDPMAQMLASVMFDLRPIGGHRALFDNLQQDTLRAASRNSIFVAHMVRNSLTHQPPLGLWRGFATIKTGEHRHALDLKHNGVVPIVDLARLYALQGQLAPVNTRARLEAAAGGAHLSESGGRNLLDAYDLIADTRLEHQAARVRDGLAPDNYLVPAALSDFDRSHLRDAFVVVKSMQAAVGHGRGMLG